MEPSPFSSVTLLRFPLKRGKCRLHTPTSMYPVTSLFLVFETTTWNCAIFLQTGVRLIHPCIVRFKGKARDTVEKRKLFASLFDEDLKRMWKSEKNRKRKRRRRRKTKVREFLTGGYTRVHYRRAKFFNI